jgi:surface protein
MNNMFEGCEKITNLSIISNWNIKNVKFKEDIFKGCNKNIPLNFK